MKNILNMSLAQKATLLGAAAMLSFTPAYAQDDEAAATGLATTEKVDLEKLRCWDVVTLAEDDRAFAMTLLYGYVIGTQGKSETSPRNVQVDVVNTMTKCVDTPDEKVLDVLKEQISR